MPESRRRKKLLGLLLRLNKPDWKPRKKRGSSKQNKLRLDDLRDLQRRSSVRERSPRKWQELQLSVRSEINSVKFAENKESSRRSWPGLQMTRNLLRSSSVS